MTITRRGKLSIPVLEWIAQRRPFSVGGVFAAVHPGALQLFRWLNRLRSFQTFPLTHQHQTCTKQTHDSILMKLHCILRKTEFQNNTFRCPIYS